MEAEAEALCDKLEVDTDTRAAIVRAARWHDVGKVHDVFQSTMRRGLGGGGVGSEAPLAKTVKRNLRHDRAYFRHELASALALLAQENWSRHADLTAYLVAGPPRQGSDESAGAAEGAGTNGKRSSRRAIRSRGYGRVMS